MELHRLKAVRVGISVTLFALVAFIFLDFRNVLPPSVIRKALYLQFIPSLMKFMDAAAIGAAGFIFVTILTLLFGRVYCSFLCPLGTLQDSACFIGRIGRKRSKFKYIRPRNILRYSVFVLTALSFIAGVGFFINLLDPFSIFGRIFANLFRPMLISFNNFAAYAFERMDSSLLDGVEKAATSPVSAGVSLVMLISIVWLSSRHGRLYCNTVCPVGALLGLLAKISFFKIGISSDACRKCRLCENSCKAGCIDIKNMSVDFSRCVGCFNCFSACPENALRFEKRFRGYDSKPAPERERREFMLNSAMWIAAIAGLPEKAKGFFQSKPTRVSPGLINPIPPPGSVSVARFTSTCTACHLCVSACPAQVLAPSFLEYGILGMMQPRMDFGSGHCNYDCNICMNVCPSGVLLPLSLERKQTTQLGVARFIMKNCVVFTDRTNCGACSEHCPTKAVDMVPFPDAANRRLLIPKVNPDICIGCGGCEHACPTRPFKAIYVIGNPVHKTAEKPLIKAVDKKIDYREDFPF